MKKTLIIILILGSILFLFSQMSPQDSKQGIILREDFNNNNYNWDLFNDESGKAEIRDGKFYYEGKDASGNLHIFNSDLTTQNLDQYVIETSIQHVSGVNEYAIGLIFGVKDGNNYYTFDITNNGYFRITKYEDGDHKKVLEWSSSDALNIDKPNKLTIIKFSTVYYFAVNDELVTMLGEQTLQGFKLGFNVFNAQAFEADYIELRHISQADKDILPSYLFTGSSENNASTSNSNEEDEYRENFQKAFRKVIDAANVYFTGLYNEDQYVDDNNKLQKLKVHFPEEYESTYYRHDYLPGEYMDDPPVGEKHVIQIDYNTVKENSALAAYGIIENDKDKMKACYIKLINELNEIKYENIGGGDWKEIDDEKYVFKMISTTDKYPQVAVVIEVGELLGVKLRFIIEEKWSE
ncbi:MAG: hypothetical protein K9M99_02925 [Candidatus Cloacimonetes bacterium]|nr:hypothetical protein [Candidatus Cloacimonadota bacterium]